MPNEKTPPRRTIRYSVIVSVWTDMVGSRFGTIELADGESPHALAYRIRRDAALLLEEMALAHVQRALNMGDDYSAAHGLSGELTVRVQITPELPYIP